MTIAYIASIIDDELIKIVYTPQDDDQDALEAILTMEQLIIVKEDWDNGVFIACNESGEQFTIQLTYLDEYTTIYIKE